jgi:Cu(I)/Ag(I) efflux system membrane fusion protein
MTTQPGTTHPARGLVIGLLLGLALGVGAMLAHQGGLLTPLYHAVGLHPLAPTSATPGEAQPPAPGHAGHGGMSLPQEAGQPSKVPGYAVVAIPQDRQQLIGVRTGLVERDHLVMSVRAVGIIEPDQTRLARLHTRVSGWVQKVHVNFVGQDVKKGDPLLEIYSPDLVSTQEEYLTALKGAGAPGGGEFQQHLAELARRRLQLWGVSPDEIRELQRTRKVRETLKLRAPISGRVLDRNVLEGSYVEPATELYRIADLSVIWLQAKVYEYELPHIELNQEARITLLAQPGAELKGKVSFIEPVLQETTRTVKVRIPVKNPDGRLKPGMYADLRIEHHMGSGLLVPESAVLRTGERAVAFRALPEGRFEPVEVKLGSRFGERVEVLAGLAEGEKVVTSAGFLIDSESRLKATASMPAGHQHGPPPGEKRGADEKHQHGGAGAHDHHHP